MPLPTLLRADRPVVKIGGIGSAHHAVRIALRDVEDFARARLRQVGERGEHAIVRLVGRDLGILSPGAVGIGVEIVAGLDRSEEHTSELQSLMRNSYAVFCLKKKKKHNPHIKSERHTNTHNKTKPLGKQRCTNK